MANAWWLTVKQGLVPIQRLRYAPSLFFYSCRRLWLYWRNVCDWWWWHLHILTLFLGLCVLVSVLLQENTNKETSSKVGSKDLGCHLSLLLFESLMKCQRQGLRIHVMLLPAPCPTYSCGYSPWGYRVRHDWATNTHLNTPHMVFSLTKWYHAVNDSSETCLAH